ncbi:exported hypothetical protein [Paraburkholderia ribeironis]|uniref:Uncharacterized protein n=1 Tax=Paraburkholderia ribeironis TaxID=1247936 RepID=A0A1N7SIW5_9BURK|nr:exported hypothetical protein [Paraburkholderia ribeironis]
MKVAGAPFCAAIAAPQGAAQVLARRRVLLAARLFAALGGAPRYDLATQVRASSGPAGRSVPSP